jgi:hypothetical protein
MSDHSSTNKKRKRRDGVGRGKVISSQESLSIVEGEKENQSRKRKKRRQQESDIITDTTDCTISSNYCYYGDKSPKSPGYDSIQRDKANTNATYVQVTDEKRGTSSKRQHQYHPDATWTIAKIASYDNFNHTPMKEMHKPHFGGKNNRAAFYQSVTQRTTPVTSFQENKALALMDRDKGKDQEEDHTKIGTVEEINDICSFKTERSVLTEHNDFMEESHDIHKIDIGASVRRESATCWWIYRSFCTLSVMMILSMVAYSTFFVYLDSSFVAKDVVQLKLYKLQEEIDRLHGTQGELQQSQEKVISCENSLSEARAEGEKLNATVTLLRERLESMVGTGDTIQASLRKAWSDIEESNKQKMEVETLLETKTLQLRDERVTKEALDVELRSCSDRIFELELDSVTRQHEMEELKSLTDDSLKEKYEMQNKLDQHQDLVALLQHRLDDENEDSWFHKMQIQHLESVQVELEGLLNDSKYEIAKLKRENIKLRQYISEQGREAVAALNAVAKSATHWKAEQLAAMETSTERLIHGVKNEAANAINYVVSTMFLRNDDTATSKKVNA